MNSQHPPCSCREEAARSDPGSPCAAAAPERNSQADPCPCHQDVCPSCPCDPAPVPLGVPSPSLPADSGASLEAEPLKTPSSAEEPVTIETPGMCVLRFPLQKSILAVELCPPDTPDTSPPPQDELCVPKTAGACLEHLEELSQELPVAALEPCTLEVVELEAVPGDPCGIPTDPCVSRGLGDAGGAEDSGPQTSPRSPVRLDSRTSSVVERCLSRCQSWFRGKK